MTRCRCMGASHGPACPLLDVFDEAAEERECRRIEAALRASGCRLCDFTGYVSAGGDWDPAPCINCSAGDA